MTRPDAPHPPSPTPSSPALQAGWAVTMVRSERRDGARRRTRLRVARAHDASGRFVCEATVVDLSAHGARLRLADAAMAPDTLWLFDETAGQVAQARVARRAAGEIGLELSAWRSLDDVAPALRRRLEAPYFGAD